MVIILKITYWILYVSILAILSYEIVLFILSFFAKPVSNSLSRKRKFLILIPAFRESEVLFSTINSIKKLNFPADLFDAVLINDECDEKVISKLKEEIKILDVNLSSHSKIESLKKAIDLTKGYDFIAILDADNLVHPDFLSEINNSISDETEVIQGLRLPKSLNSTFEKIDAMTDFVYNQIDRIIPSRLGLTGTISGSGFAIKTDLFQELIPIINTKGGFDKILQSELLLRNIPVEVCSNAIVFDEKTMTAKSYSKQRTRWLYYHFYNSFKYGLKLFFTGIINRNLNQIHLGLISIRPPINLIYFISFILIITGFWICSFCSITIFLALVLFSIIILQILIKHKILSFNLILSLPLIFINQLKSLFNLRTAKNDSLKTEHFDSKSVDEILQNSEVTEEK
jgi:cellulose synthase/poly-beta-1,6-N-acetylglucosamine synthase-like glycosyltransferase